MYGNKSVTALDVICVAVITLLTWLLVELIYNGVFQVTWSLIFFCVIFYVYPIIVILLNHLNVIQAKKFSITVTSVICILLVIIHSIILAVQSKGFDIGIFIFCLVFSLTPILILFINIKYNV